MPRVAKLDPFSRCRSETTRRRSSSQNSAPDASAVNCTPAISSSAAANSWLPLAILACIANRPFPQLFARLSHATRRRESASRLRDAQLFAIGQFCERRNRIDADLAQQRTQIVVE